MQKKQNKKQLPVVAIIGTAGAGKTNAASNSFKCGMLDRWVYFLNDAGNPESVNLTDLPNGVDLRPMANGCFSCEDDQQLRELIASMAEAYEEQDDPDIKGVLLEGYGFVAGDETLSLLKKLNLPYHIACVFDAEHFHRNLAIYAGIMENQIKAATANVWITKYPTGVTEVEDEKLQQIVEYIKQCNPWTECYLLPRDGKLPAQVFEPDGFAEVHHRCGHECNHRHEHAHNEHALVEYHFRLIPGATAQQLKQSLVGSAIVRTKGVALGNVFHSVYDTWEIRSGADSRQFVIVYCESGFDPLSINAFAQLVQVTLQNASTLSLIRTDEIEREETLTLVEELLKSVPSEPVWNSFDQLVTHPEMLQVVKEISRRPNVKDDIYVTVIEKCCEYWLKCARQVSHVSNDSERANNLRELSISLGWWAVEFKSNLPSNLLSEITLVRPAAMLSEGLAGLEYLNSNPEKAYWQVQEILKVCDFADQNGESSDVVDMILKHGVRIANSSSLDNASSYIEAFAARMKGC